MLSLTQGTLVEDFDYGYPYTQPVAPRPPEFDYSGRALSSQGMIVCAQQTFTLQYGHGADNADAALAYGGSSIVANNYLRYPVLSWGATAGLFLTVTTTARASLEIDRAFSGYVGDHFIVSINDIERLDITGSAGYGWTRNTIPLVKGINRIAFLLLTAAYTGTGTVRQGIAQPSSSFTELFRYLRLSNLQITNVASLPAAQHTLVSMLVEVSGSFSGDLKITSGLVRMQVNTTLLCPMVISGPVFMSTDTDLNGDNALIGKIGQLSMTVGFTATISATIGVHHATDTGGFGLSARASLQVFSTVPIDTSTLIRPLKKTSLRMSVPAIISGTPITPTASCLNDVDTILGAAQVIRRVDPYSPANVVPVTATWRWLSLDAASDPFTNELTQWHPTTFSGPVWSTPKDYRPTVGNFVMKRSGRTAAVAYPSVQFDAGHLDHVLMRLPTSSMTFTGAMTWVIVGSFTRYRGQPHDNCPILDFAPDQVVDYHPDAEFTAIRNDFMPWVDDDDATSIYLGLTAYSDKDHTSSRIAYRTNDVTQSFARSSDVVLVDGTPVVLIYRLNDSHSLISVTPLVAGQSGALTTKFTRTVADPYRTTFALGKSRIVPPYSGSFLTGTMSLLEVAFYNRALSDDEVTSLATFYPRMYMPVAGDISEPDYTTGATDVTGEQVLVYAADPETPLAVVSGGRAVVLDVYPSTVNGRIEIDRFNKQGVPLARVTNRDYSALLAHLEGS